MNNGYGRSADGFDISQRSVELIVKTALENGVSDSLKIACMPATAQHETHNFTAVDEDLGQPSIPHLVRCSPHASNAPTTDLWRHSMPTHPFQPRNENQ